jgi:hypothetical protein
MGDGMDAMDAGMTFPVLGFTPDGDVWGFPGPGELTECGPATLKEGLYVGLELIVRAATRVGAIPLKSLLHVFSPRLNRVRLEVAEETAVTLEAAKGRVCTAIDAFPQFWSEDVDDPAELLERRRDVLLANSFAEIHEKLGLDWFADY